MSNYVKAYHSMYLLAQRINLMYKMRRKKLLSGIHMKSWLVRQSSLWPSQVPCWCEWLLCWSSVATDTNDSRVHVKVWVLQRATEIEHWDDDYICSLCIWRVGTWGGLGAALHNQSILYACCFWEFMCLCTVGFSCIDFLCSNSERILWSWRMWSVP